MAVVYKISVIMMDYTISYTEIRYLVIRSWHTVCSAVLVYIKRQKRIMRVQHGGIALLGLFNVLLNAFILYFIT